MHPIPASERSLTAKVAAHHSWAATTDRTARTAAARAAFRQKFLDEADGDPVRAEHLRKAYYYGLRLKSMKAQRQAREQQELAAAAEAELKAMGGEES